MNPRSASLSIRRWVGLVLGVIIAVPVLAATCLYTTVSWWQQRSEQSSFTTAQRIIGVDMARWGEPAWQKVTRRRLVDLDVDALLFTADGRLELATAPSLPRKPRAWQEWVGQKVAIPTADRGRDGVAGLFVSVFPRSKILIGSLAGGLLTLLPTLAGVAWFLKRTLVSPLRALSYATKEIKDGRLDIRLPTSRVREVTEVANALETMSAGLRDALQSQAAMEQERRLFIGAIAHDLRTPVFTLRAYLGGLSEGLATTAEKVERYVAVCQEKAAALERLITDLFAFARIEYLEQEPRREPLELGILLRQQVDDLGPRAASGVITLVMDDPGVPCPFVGDRDLLTRALENLFDNALRYTPAGGEIRVNWRVEDSQFVFRVADTGPGLSAEDLPHLFTPLYRSEASRNRQTGGVGLGLSIARRILQAHGGDLTAGNGATGGAVFTGTLPVTPSAPPAGG